MMPLRRFVFRLALESGYWVFNPDAMLERMPHRILLEWLQYDDEEPFGQIPLRLGYATAALGNLWGKPKGKRAWQAADFMPDRRVVRPVASADKQMDTIYMAAQLLGAEIKDPKGLLKKRYGG